jgi:nucleoid-associated protein YgaU
MTTYTTREGDRWDTISQAVYGRPDMYSKIWTANEDVCDAL